MLRGQRIRDTLEQIHIFINGRCRVYTPNVRWSKYFIPTLTRDFGFVGTRGTGFGSLVAKRHEEVLTEVLWQLALQERLHEDLKALEVNLLQTGREDAECHVEPQRNTQGLHNVLQGFKLQPETVVRSVLKQVTCFCSSLLLLHVMCFLFSWRLHPSCWSLYWIYESCAERHISGPACCILLWKLTYYQSVLSGCSGE